MGALRSGTRILLVLDFDGTLTPIVRRPDAARLHPAVRQTLRRLAADRRVRLAIVSGRSLADLRRRVGLPGIVYGGCHGLELRGPALRYTHPAARSARARLRAAGARLAAGLGGYPGARLEPKRCALAVHYRGVPPPAARRLRRLVERLAHEARLGILPGKRVWDLVPPGHAGKAAALRRLLREFRAPAGARRVLTLYAGDDTTDADVFRTLGRRILGVQVGGRRGLAAYRLPGVPALHTLLRRVADVVEGVPRLSPSRCMSSGM